jgi:Ca2+-binding RTX toxin-like protein
LIVGAKLADPDSKSNAGKSYVVFGKTDSTAINLSAIPLMTNPPVPLAIADRSIAVLSFLPKMTWNFVQQNAGKSYVVFGKTDTNAIDLTKLSGDLQYAIDYLGDENANTLTGTSDNEIFVAGVGDDTLIGNGGMDVLNAGEGNDTITINASNITALAQTSAGNRARVNPETFTESPS